MTLQIEDAKWVKIVGENWRNQRIGTIAVAGLSRHGILGRDRRFQKVVKLLE